MKKLFTLAAAMLMTFGLYAADPTTTLDVAEAAGSEDYVSANLDANTPKSLTYCGYNSSGSGSNSAFMEGTNRWKLSSSRTISFKVSNCDSVALNAYFTKDNTTTLSYTIGTESAVGFLTNGTDKKCEKAGGFKTNTADEILFTISANNDALLGEIKFFTGSSTPSTDSVEVAEVTGANECYVGQSVTLTCTAAHATTYQWYNIDGEIAGATAKTYVFEAAAVGSYGFYCMASNQYNVEPVRSNSFVVEVSPTPAQCGLLVSATTNGAVSGVATGSTISTNLGTGSSKKLDKSKYFGINLGIGTFQAGDTFAIHITAAADLGKFMLYGDNAGTDLVYDQGIVYTKSDVAEPVLCPTGWMEVILPAAANGKSALYLYRENGNTQWNVTFDSIAVYRSCEASSDATISRVYVVVGEEEQVFTQDADTFYFNIPYEVGGMTSIPVNYVLSHPAATATPASPFVMNIPEPGQKVEQVVTVTAEDGTTTKAYTIRGIRNASLSNDATLTSLSVTGYTLVPAFASDVYEYTITKAYGAQNPGSDLAVYEAAQGAHGVRSSSADGDTIYITVTAEDNVTSLVYSIAILEGAAPRALNEIFMSNNYLAYILEGDATNTIHAFYLEGETAPTVDSCTVSEGATWSVADGKLIVSGADNQSSEYPLEIAAVAPLVFTADVITFDSTNMNDVPWVKAAYGFDASKGGWKFSKTDNDYSREKAGKTHVEMFLPACDTLFIAAGEKGTERNVQFYINGEAFGEEVKLTKAGIKLAVEQSAAFMLTVSSAQTSGDGGIGAIQLIEAGEAPQPTLYRVTIDGETENGAVGVQIVGSSMEFEAGTELTLANIPEEGYELDEYIVYKTGEPTTLVTVTDGKFIMPAYDVTVSATFKLIPVVEMFTVTLGSYDHGTVAIIEPNEGNKYEAGAEVRLSVTPDEGYELEAISLEGIDLAIQVVDGVASFNMPAQDVTVLATFKQSSGQGFDNIDASMKATKRIINGKLFIEKNGKLYDAQGAMVK